MNHESRPVKSNPPLDEVDIEASAVSSTETQSTIPCSPLDNGKLTAETWWALNHVVCGYSYNSVRDSNKHFQSHISR